MTAAEAHQLAVIAEWVLAAFTLIGLLIVVAPYGRHLRPGWGPTLGARSGWILMESPAVLAFVAIFLAGPNRTHIVPQVLLGLWLLHYLNRTFVYPFRATDNQRRMPWLIAGLAIVFNGLNAWVNAGWIGWFGAYPADWLSDPRFLTGAGLFLIGFGINQWADHRLLTLRRRASDYVVPRGGLFDRVACPNYFGECLEWIGWAIATWSWAGAAFAAYTLANLLPRALAHRRWYRQRFPDYPAERKALVPFLI